MKKIVLIFSLLNLLISAALAQTQLDAKKIFTEIENDISKNISDNYRCEIYNKYYPNEKEQILNKIERKIDSSYNISFNYNSLIPSFFGQMHIINYIKAINEYNSKVSSPIETIYVITHVRVGPTGRPTEQAKELSELSYNRSVFLTRLIRQLNPKIKIIALPTMNEIKNEPGCILTINKNEFVELALNLNISSISENSKYKIDNHYESAESDIVNYIENKVDISTQSYENNFRRIPVEYMYFYTNKYPNQLIYNSLIPAIENGKKAIYTIVEKMNIAIRENNLDQNKYTLSAFTFGERVDNERYK